MIAGPSARSCSRTEQPGEARGESGEDRDENKPGHVLGPEACGLDFWLTSEDLPDPNNRVTLDRNGNIVLSYQPNNDTGHKRLIKKLEDLLQHLDMHPHLVPRNLFVGNRIPLGGVAHQNGTIRFGRDPRTSALDVNCKAHELDNLYVVDGSFFVSSGAVNPALTIMANALRVGERILERLHAKTGAAAEAIG